MRLKYLLIGVTLFAASRPADIVFEKRALDLGSNETCTIADINGDDARTSSRRELV
jgi:hypothetical protein